MGGEDRTGDKEHQAEFSWDKNMKQPVGKTVVASRNRVSQNTKFIKAQFLLPRFFFFFNIICVLVLMQI